VKFVLLAMLAMVVGSFVLELVLPQNIKNRLGTAVCWAMMATTMTFLGISTLGLIYTTYAFFIAPRLGN
jgi:hypothetical protein